MQKICIFVSLGFKFTLLFVLAPLRSPDSQKAVRRSQKPLSDWLKHAVVNMHNLSSIYLFSKTLPGLGLPFLYQGLLGTLPCPNSSCFPSVEETAPCRGCAYPMGHPLRSRAAWPGQGAVSGCERAAYEQLFTWNSFKLKSHFFCIALFLFHTANAKRHTALPTAASVSPASKAKEISSPSGPWPRWKEPCLSC